MENREKDVDQKETHHDDDGQDSSQSSDDNKNTSISPPNGHRTKTEYGKHRTRVNKEHIRRRDGSDSGSNSSPEKKAHRRHHHKGSDRHRSQDSERRRKARNSKPSESDSDDDHHQSSSRHRKSHHRSHHRSSHDSSKRRQSRSRNRRHTKRSSKSRSRSRKRSGSRGHSSSQRRRSRSPRNRKGSHKVEAQSMKDTNHASTFKDRRSRSNSPFARGYDRAMDAQERLARRLERARELMKRKEESKKEVVNLMEGKSADERVQEAVKRAAQLLSCGNNALPQSTQDSIAIQVSAKVAALQAKALADTGIAVPSYYNPLAVNPISYAQQAAKRKKLWAKKEDNSEKPEESHTSSLSGKTALWSGVKFGDDKSNEKFAKLMGIKAEKIDESASKEATEIIKKQAEVFQNLDMQYQQARITTHTQRGLGLGFSSSMIDPNNMPATQPTTTNT